MQEPKLSQPKTIVLWGQDDLLTQVVEALLGSQAGWEVIRISDQYDEAALASKLKIMEPHVLVVHQDVFSRSLRQLFEFVQKYSVLRIITINLDNNEMEIFNKQTVCLKEVSEFMSIIADEIRATKGGQTDSPTHLERQFHPVPCTAKNTI